MLALLPIATAPTTMPDPQNQDSGTPLISRLRRPDCYPHAVAAVELLETHISWVLLTGEYAYKIKKPVSLGFLDFSTLEQRQQYCGEEVRLNRRFAPGVYLGCVAVTGSIDTPKIGGEGPAIEYAVCMRQFPQTALASALLTAGKLSPRHLEDFAATLGAFHQAAAATDAGSVYGTAQSVLEAALQNFDQLSPLLTSPGDDAALAAMRQWTLREHDAKKGLMEQRRVAGAVRECHGDLHLGNIVLIDNRLVPFDCIEFNPALRWNDVLSEAAFLVMDLHDRGSPGLGRLFLNSYLEHTQDHAGLALLPFYLVYRAMVRAKVHGLRAVQPGLDPDKRASLLQASRTYLALAGRFAHPPHPALIITHGLSGSGKSRIAGELLQQLDAIRIRSDMERKRLHGIAPQERHGATAGLYGEQATAATYRHLAGLAQEIIAAGYTAIVDAACLQHWQRDLLRGVARAAGVTCLNLAVTAPVAVLRARISQRQAAGNDPSDAELTVLEQQLQNREALEADELRDTIELASGEQDPQACCRQALAALEAKRAADRKTG